MSGSQKSLLKKKLKKKLEGRRAAADLRMNLEENMLSNTASFMHESNRNELGQTCFTGCDSGCTLGCDKNCAFCTSGCDKGCTRGCDKGWLKGCDKGCTSGCDKNCACVSGCDTGCLSGCDESCVEDYDYYSKTIDGWFDNGKKSQKSSMNTEGGATESNSTIAIFAKLKNKADKAWKAYKKPFDDLLKCKNINDCWKTWSNFHSIKPDTEGAQEEADLSGTLEELESLGEEEEMKSMAQEVYEKETAAFLEAKAAGRHREHVASLIERSRSAGGTGVRIKHSSLDAEGKHFTVESNEEGTGGNIRLSKQVALGHEAGCQDPPSGTCFQMEVALSLAYLFSVFEVGAGMAAPVGTIGQETAIRFMTFPDLEGSWTLDLMSATIDFSIKFGDCDKISGPGFSLNMGVTPTDFFTGGAATAGIEMVLDFSCPSNDKAKHHSTHCDVTGGGINVCAGASVGVPILSLGMAAGGSALEDWCDPDGYNWKDLEDKLIEN